MAQENAVVMTLFQFCTMNEVQNVDNEITLKIFSNANSVKFMQEQLVTQLLAQLLHRESKKGCHPNHGYNFVNS